MVLQLKLAMGWMVQCSNPGVGEGFLTLIQPGPKADPATCTVGVGSLSVGKVVRTGR